MEKFDTIGEYIASFPEETQVILKRFRKIIGKIAPQATESMSYRMPTFKLNGKNLVHFAAFKNHIGFFPTPSGIDALEKETKIYIRSQNTPPKIEYLGGDECEIANTYFRGIKA